MSGEGLGLEQAVGQLLMVGFEGLEAPAAILEALALGEIGGVILFRRNVGDVEQLATLNESLHEAAAGVVAPPLVGVDQEGGRVVRIRQPLTPIPPMRRLGQRGNADRVARASEAIATELGALGFNVNFAPVLDVDTNPANPVIGDRAFSSDPRQVARLGGAFVLGHVMSGVIPCGKHFPGHGDTDQDSHLTLPTVDRDEAVLRAVELFPFAELARVGVPMLMTAHILVPALDPEHPATLSRPILQGLLRERLGYQGVVVTDDLEMRAVAERYEVEEMVELGLRAGVDIQLICHTEALWRRARTRLLELASGDEEARCRVQESAERVLRMKREGLSSWPRPWRRASDWRAILGCDEHYEAIEAAAAPASGDTGGGSDPTEWDRGS